MGTAYLAETKNFVLKVLYIKLKSSKNNTLRLMNSTKKCNGIKSMNSRKNKLNSKKKKKKTGFLSQCLTQPWLH